MSRRFQLTKSSIWATREAGYANGWGCVNSTQCPAPRRVGLSHTALAMHLLLQATCWNLLLCANWMIPEMDKVEPSRGSHRLFKSWRGVIATALCDMCLQEIPYGLLCLVPVVRFKRTLIEEQQETGLLFGCLSPQQDKSSSAKTLGLPRTS